MTTVGAWKLYKEDTIADDADYYTTQSVPAGEDIPLGQDPVPGTDLGVRVCLVWLDGLDGNVVAGGGVDAYSVTVFEVTRATDLEGTNVGSRVLRGATLAGLNSDEVFLMGEFSLGRIALRFFDITAPGGATHYRAYVREY